MPDLIILYSPFPTLASARAASAALLAAKHAACCNLLTGMESHYVWQGVPTTSTETILIAKTLPAMAELARATIRSHHPYECPAILAFSADADPAFAAWVAASLTA